MMNRAGKITSIRPLAAIPGGEVIIECEGFEIRTGEDYACLFDGVPAQIIGASTDRVIVIVPEDAAGDVSVRLESGDSQSQPEKMIIGLMLADGLHIVSNPAFDGDEEKIIVTRSGSRGQQMPVTLFRLTLEGELEDISGDLMNPTGVAFDKNGQLFVTSRAEGSVYRVNRQDEALPFAHDLGIATGIAFDKLGQMYVGDRSGTIFKINSFGETETFANLEQSIAAYHLAFGLDDTLYVSRPNVASSDSIMKIDQDGEVSTFYKGLGRPQGLAFDREGNLYVAANQAGRRGIIRISPDGEKSELFVTGMNVVGLCFGANGEMFLATNEAVYSLQLGVKGTLVG